MNEITITLDAQELQSFAQLLDFALRYAGMGALAGVNHFDSKIEAAKQQAAKLRMRPSGADNSGTARPATEEPKAA